MEEHWLDIGGMSHTHHELDQGWHHSNKKVCRSCIDDPTLKAAIRSSGMNCDFCSNNQAGHLDDVIQAFMTSIEAGYEPEANYTSGFLDIAGSTTTTWDLAGDIDAGPPVIEAIQKQLVDVAWISKDNIAGFRN